MCCRSWIFLPSATQFRAAPYRLRTATHRLPISSCGAAAKVAPHFHKAAAPTCWGHAHSRIAAYLHGIRSFRIVFRSNAVAVSPLVMHISATTVNDRIMMYLGAELGPLAAISRYRTQAPLTTRIPVAALRPPRCTPPGATKLKVRSLKNSVCSKLNTSQICNLVVQNSVQQCAIQRLWRREWA